MIEVGVCIIYKSGQHQPELLRGGEELCSRHCTPKSNDRTFSYVRNEGESRIRELRGGMN